MKVRCVAIYERHPRLGSRSKMHRRVRGKSAKEHGYVFTFETDSRSWDHVSLDLFDKRADRYELGRVYNLKLEG